jgi:hypothetical protein
MSLSESSRGKLRHQRHIRTNVKIKDLRMDANFDFTTKGGYDSEAHPFCRKEGKKWALSRRF